MLGQFFRRISGKAQTGSTAEGMTVAVDAVQKLDAAELGKLCYALRSGQMWGWAGTSGQDRLARALGFESADALMAYIDSNSNGVQP